MPRLLAFACLALLPAACSRAPSWGPTAAASAVVTAAGRPVPGVAVSFHLWNKPAALRVEPPADVQARTGADGKARAELRFVEDEAFRAWRDGGSPLLMATVAGESRSLKLSFTKTELELRFEFPDLLRLAAEGAVSLDDRTVAELLPSIGEKLERGGTPERGNAVNLLRRLGALGAPAAPAVAAALASALQAGDGSRFGDAARAAGALGPSGAAAIASLLPALAHPDEDIRYNAREALKAIATPDALAALQRDEAEGGPPYRNATEKEWLPRLQGIVERSGGKLLLKHDGRVVRELVDHLDGGGSDVSYRLAVVKPENKTTVIEVGYYEGGDVLLFDYGRGKAEMIGAKPVWSPSGRRFAVVQCPDAYNEPRMSIWRLAEDAIAREWPTANPEECGGSVKWTSEDELEFVRAEPGGESPGKPVGCRRAADSWRCLDSGSAEPVAR